MNKRLQASISINRIKEANEICSISKLNVWLFVAICNAETKPSLPWLRFRSLAPLTLTLLSQGGCVCSLLSFVCVPLISPWKKQGRLIFTNGGPSFPSELVQNQKKNEQNPTFQLETFESVFTFQFPVSLSIIGLAKFYCCPIPRNRNLGNLKKNNKRLSSTDPWISKGKGSFTFLTKQSIRDCQTVHHFALIEYKGVFNWDYRSLAVSWPYGLGS